MSEQINDRTLSALQKLYEAAQELEQLGYRVTATQESNYPPKMGDTYTVFEVQNTYRRNDNNELVPVGHGFTLDGKPGKVVMSLRAGNPFHYTIGAAGENISDKFHQVMKFLGNLQPLSNSYLFEIPDNPYMRNRNNVEAMRDGLERMRKLRADLGTVPKELSSEAQEMLEAFRTNCKLKPSIFNGIMARNSGVRKSDICQWAIRQLMEEGMDHTAACRCVYGGTFGDDSEMTIGEEGVKQMVDLINNPPPPNDVLKNARQKYLSQSAAVVLHDVALLDVDPWDPDLTDDMKQRIIRECCVNEQYFFKTVAKLTVKADVDSYIWTEGGQAKLAKLEADIEAFRKQEAALTELANNHQWADKPLQREVVGYRDKNGVVISGVYPTTCACPECNAVWVFYPPAVHAGVQSDAALSLKTSSSCKECEPNGIDVLEVIDATGLRLLNPNVSDEMMALLLEHAYRGSGKPGRIEIKGVHLKQTSRDFLFDKSLRLEDPWNPEITDEAKERIVTECKRNPHYFSKVISIRMTQASADTRTLTPPAMEELAKKYPELAEMYLAQAAACVYVFAPPHFNGKDN